MTYAVTLTTQYSRERAHRLVDAAPEGYVVRVDAPKRTNDQNRLLWQLLTDVSMSKPMGRKHVPEVWKDLFCHACGHAVQFETGIDGQPFPVGFRTSRMSKAQMSELIEFIYAWGTGNGVRWSDHG